MDSPNLVRGPVRMHGLMETDSLLNADDLRMGSQLRVLQQRSRRSLGAVVVEANVRNSNNRRKASAWRNQHSNSHKLSVRPDRFSRKGNEQRPTLSLRAVR